MAEERMSIERKARGMSFSLAVNLKNEYFPRYSIYGPSRLGCLAIRENPRGEIMAKMQKEETEVKVTDGQADGAAPAPAPEIAAAKEPEMTRGEKADAIVRTYMLWSMAGGVAPAIVDTIIVSGVQIRMIHSLAKLYAVPFTQNMGKSVLASLAGGVGAGSVSRGGLGTALKLIPIVGPFVGCVAMPVLAGASSFAIGKLFIQHFESGGTFLDFDPSKVKDHFEKLYQQGKEMASNIHKASKPEEKKEEKKPEEKKAV